MSNHLKQVARKLRRDQTPAEVKLWRLLRNRHFLNLKFRRQFPVGNYIADFCCREKNLIIELDGGQHNKKDAIIFDQQRDNYFRQQGFTTLRVWNNELQENPEGVLEKIKELLGL